MGALAALLGAWAAIVGFVGPEFGYQATNNSSWQWTTANWLLHLVPGAVAFVAGLCVMFLARASTLSARSMLRLAALVIIASGAWLVIGPALWPVFESGSPYGPAGTAQTSFTNQIGANLGPGLLLVLLGGMIYQAVGASRPAPAYDAPVAGAPVAGAVGEPGGVYRTSAGAVDSPAGAVDVPAGAVESPAGAVESPAGAVDKPTGSVDRPAGAVDEPAGAVDSPTGSYESPTGTLHSPSSEGGRADTAAQAPEAPADPAAGSLREEDRPPGTP
jgi:hypothetical protein